MSDDFPNRQTVRLQGYDYYGNGLYFITICTHNHENLFGKIENGAMVLNEIGVVVNDLWHKIPQHFSNAKTYEFVVMPDHIHGIILIQSQYMDRARHAVPLRILSQYEKFGKPTMGTVPTIIRSYKSAVTKSIHNNNQFTLQSIWQRNYHEHIIRNEDSYHKISEYIKTNPANWQNDIYFRDTP